MSIWLAVVIAAPVVFVAGVILLAISWRTTSEADRRLVKRVMALPFRRKLTLASCLMRDRRIPMRARLIPPALVVYLASPIDLIPDFIPVLGQLDDLVAVVVGVRLLLRYTPRSIIETHLALLERPAP